jgi:integrase
MPSALATSTKTAYTAIKITPAQTLLILRSVMGNLLPFTLVFVVAATALRSSEVLSLRWADILWEERKILIVKAWKKLGVARWASMGSAESPSQPVELAGQQKPRKTRRLCRESWGGFKPRSICTQTKT